MVKNIKLFTMVLLAIMNCQLIYANPQNDTNKLKDLEGKYSNLQDNLSKLLDKQKASEHKTHFLISQNAIQKQLIDSLQKKCNQLDQLLSIDREDFNGKINKTQSSVQESRSMLENRTLVISLIVVALLLIIIVTVALLTKRIKSRDNSIAEVRKAQEVLYSAQIKMQEESVNLDDKLLKVLDKQILDKHKVADKSGLDHSLALKVADEIVRIELNMSRMDDSVKGYKQLAKAVERIKDNFKANGYEIIDMLGKPYNEGMKVIANFVADENIEFGTQIITGITKPQINYNGQMIQSAQITVSQNI